MICFEVVVNQKTRFVVGGEGASVLSLIASYVSERNEFELTGGAMRTEGENESVHLGWQPHSLAPGDEVVLRVLESGEPTLPTSRTRHSAADRERSERAYYERMKARYESDT